MDDLTSRPWWRWTTGLVVRVEGWGGRPVPCGVVVGSDEMARVADEWGTTPRIVELQAMAGVRVVPNLDHPATVGVLLGHFREIVREKLPGQDIAPSVEVTRAAVVRLIRAIDDVTGADRG